MPTPNEYASNAERQAAYRDRHRDRKPPRQEYLAALGHSVHCMLGEAVHAGCSPWPMELLGARADETLRNLVFYLRAHTQEAADR